MKIIVKDVCIRSTTKKWILSKKNSEKGKKINLSGYTMGIFTDKSVPCYNGT